MISGEALSSNLELLRSAREDAGRDAYPVYKLHPDVLVGGRRRQIALSRCFEESRWRIAAHQLIHVFGKRWIVS